MNCIVIVNVTIIFFIKYTLFYKSDDCNKLILYFYWYNLKTYLFSVVYEYMTNNVIVSLNLITSPTMVQHFLVHI